MIFCLTNSPRQGPVLGKDMIILVEYQPWFYYWYYDFDDLILNQLDWNNLASLTA